MRFAVWVLVATLVGATVAPTTVAKATVAVAGAVPGELIVALESGGSFQVASLDRLSDRLNISDIAPLSADPDSTLSRYYRVSVSPETNLAAAASALAASTLVASVQPNYIYRAAFTPNDTNFALQWHLSRVGAEAAWQTDAAAPLYGGDPSVVVAVLDTGITVTDDLAGTAFATGFDFVNGDADTTDDNGHGTHMAGTIAQTTNNGTGTAGLAFNTTLMPVKVLNAAGSGSSATIAAGIDFARTSGAEVISMSFSQDTGSTSDPVLAAAVSAAASTSVLVAATGNDGVGAVSYPAAYDGVIAVGATNYADTRSSFSNYGSGIDLVAPGGEAGTAVISGSVRDGILQQTFTGSYAWASGTSSAAAHVSGAAALLLAAGASTSGVAATLASSAVDLGTAGFDVEYGSGRLDIATALGGVITDVIAPTITVSAPTEGAVLSARTATVTGRVTDNLAGAIAFTADGTSQTVAADGSFSFTVVVRRWTNSIDLVATDAAGNSSQTTVHVTAHFPELIVAGAGPGGSPQVRVFDASGTPTGQFNAYASTFRGGVNVASGDIDGDSEPEIITAPVSQGGPHVQVFSGSGQHRYNFFAYDDSFRGGVNVAVGDLDGDGRAEIVTAPASAGGPNIRIFSLRNDLIVPTTENFFAYASSFRGGVRVTVADLEGDGIGEIITVPASAGGPQLRVFGYRSGRFQPVVLGLDAYASSFRGGVTLAAGDTGGRSYDTVVTGIAAAGGPQVRQFARNTNGVVALTHPGFMAFAPAFRGGVSLAVADLSGDGSAEIVTAVRSGDQPLVRIFSGDTRTIVREFLAFPAGFRGGVTLAAL